MAPVPHVAARSLCGRSDLLTVWNYLKGVGQYFLAEVLCLFLSVTFSALGGTVWRIVGCICNIGVLLCLCINYGYNRAEEDRRHYMDFTIGRCLFYSSSVSVIYIVLGVLLLLSRLEVLPTGFYRWYKLLDAPFLQLCNICSSEITADTLSYGQTALLCLVNLAPFLATAITYAIVRKGVDFTAMQYVHKK